jgi:hypothetical protein
VNRPKQLFNKNTSLRKVERQRMGADACPVSIGYGSWLFLCKSSEKLVT